MSAPGTSGDSNAGLFPNLGFDPAPGNPATVGSVATQLRTTARTLDEAHRALARMGHSDGIWRSTAATAFRVRSAELPPILDTAGSSLQQAGRALEAWSDDLVSLQKKAVSLEELARVARSKVAAAESNPALQERYRTYSDPDRLAAAQARLDSAVAELDRARTTLDDIIARAESLRTQHRGLVDETTRVLRKAAEQAPDEGLFERLGRRLDDFLDDVGELFEDIWDYVQDNADLINELSNTLATLSSVLGAAAAVTFYFPAISGPLGTAALGLGVAALAGHALAKAAGAEVTATTFVVDIVGVATGGIGKVASTLGDGAGMIAKGADSIGDAQGAAAAAVRQAQLEVVDKAAGRIGTGTALTVPIAAQLTGAEGVTNIFQDVNKYVLPDTPSEQVSTLILGPISGSVFNTLVRESS